jgi:hypothetical protein
VQSIVLIAFVVLLTSAVARTIAVSWLSLDRLSLGRAGLKTLETVGMAAIFCGANLITGMIIIAIVHALTGRFVSHYILRDMGLLSLSLLQGMVFVWWYSTSARAA